MKYYFLAFKNIFNFKDEANLKEFWFFFIINILISGVVAYICKKLALPDYVFTIYRTVMILVLVSVGFRRLKNAGYSGWLFLIPIINLVFASMPQKEVKKV
ncbi:DUF805 domain-containing protein [Flavobacterium sp.]|uniref:DUF805 domain-containing protein n=1 Tax=Flavobacterium sp. TaxID=239 RepID=UPI00374D0071